MSEQRTAFSVAAVQSEPLFGDVAGSLAALDQQLLGVEGDLIVLPELCSTGYSFRDRDEALAHAETFPDGPFCGERPGSPGPSGRATITRETLEDSARIRLFVSSCAADSVTVTIRVHHSLPIA